MNRPCHPAPALVLTVALLGGCAAPTVRELSPATTQAQLEARRLDDPALRKLLTDHGQPAGDTWDLDRLTLAAFHFSPNLDVARARLAEAEAGVRSAQALPNPTFTFTPGRNLDAPAGVSPWILGYALSLPLELAGQRTYRTAEARHHADAARFALARTAWEVRRAVRHALTALHSAEATAQLWRDTRPLLVQAAQLTDARVQAGDGSPLETAQARVALHRAELAARDSERELAAARSRLAEAVGVPLAALADARFSYAGLTASGAPPDAAEARRRAAQNRADLLASLATFAAAQSALQAEVVRRYGDLSIGPGYELDQGDGKWSLALGVTLPIFQRHQGPIAAAQARRDTAAAEFLALQNRVLAEVDRAHADCTAALADLDAARQLRTSIARQAQLAAARQAAGETSRLDLVRTQIELAEHTRTELAVHLRAEQAWGALEDAAQRPLAWPDAAWRTSARTAASPSVNP